MDWGILQTVLTIVFGIVAVFSLLIAFKNARRQKPVWAFNTRHIIGREAEAPPELKLLFSDREVKDLYRTELIFFNRGNEVIESTDVAEPIGISFNKAEILKQPSVVASRDNIDFSVSLSPDKHSLVMYFNFLGHNDGAFIEIWHNDDDKPSFFGQFKNTSASQEKIFIRSRPKDLSDLIAAAIIVVGFLVWMWWSSIPISLNVTNLAVLLIFSLIAVVGLTIGFRRKFEYKKFPPWSRLESS